MDDLPWLASLTIQEVARRTGTTVSTLRAWERRCGIPRPSRTASGHRLYAQPMIEQIKLLKHYCSTGIRPQQAAALVAQATRPAAASPKPSRTTGWQQRLKRACVRFDDVEAQSVLKEASRSTGTLAAIRQVVFPVVRTLGDAWHQGLITISQEHYVSQLARRMALARLDASDAARRRTPILLACAPKERHELGLLLLACELQDRGRPVLYLGAEMPVGAFLATLDAVGATLAVVSITIPEALTPWLERRNDVQRRRNVTFVWGGPGATLAQGKLAGVTTESVDDALELILRLAPEKPSGPTAAERMRKARAIKKR